MGNTDTEVFFGESSSEMNTLDRQKQIAMIMKMMMVVVLTTMFTIVRIVYNKKKIYAWLIFSTDANIP